MLACVFHKQCNHRLMWVSVYVNPLKQFGSEDRQEKKNCGHVCFLSLAPPHYCSEGMGNISTQVKDRDRGAGITWNLCERWCLLGLISVFFRRWILSSWSTVCDVIVYYPRAGISNRELAGGLAVGELSRCFNFSIIMKCPLTRSWISDISVI